MMDRKEQIRIEKEIIKIRLDLAEENRAELIAHPLRTYLKARHVEKQLNLLSKSLTPKQYKTSARRITRAVRKALFWNRKDW
jgi:hypothetical protein